LQLHSSYSMLFYWSIIISLGIMPYAVRYGSVKVVCLTTGDSKQLDASITDERRFADGPHTMIKNHIAKCTVLVDSRDYFWSFKDRIVFRLDCVCGKNDPKIHRVEHRKKGFSNGGYQGFISCDARDRLWWSMKFTPNKVMDIIFTALNIAPRNYACGAHGSAWQNTIASSVHNFFGLDGHQCCERHDICYARCGRTRGYCDRRFRKCLFRACKRAHKGRSGTCHTAASFTSDIVDSDLANKAFKTAQRGCEHIRK